MKYKYLMFKDGEGFALYSPNDGSVKHTLNYSEATEASLDDWSNVLPDFSDYHRIDVITP